jgi:hypothetical protein
VRRLLLQVPQVSRRGVALPDEPLDKLAVKAPPPRWGGCAQRRHVRRADGAALVGAEYPPWRVGAEGGGGDGGELTSQHEMMMSAFSQGQNDIGAAYGKKRRENLPPRSVEVLKKWFFEHLRRPYPTVASPPPPADTWRTWRSSSLPTRGSRAACECSNVLKNISVIQVSNWFVNARKRNWQHLLEKQYGKVRFDL